VIKHSILGDKVHVYKRERSRFWQCGTFLEGKFRRASTKCERLPEAKDFAEEWYLELRGKKGRGELLIEKTLSDASKLFFKEQAVILANERSPPG